ncbi:hypothetical protein [Pseudomonas sp. FSL R10-1339]|uniref:hypothetical protein n=1 Tax=Pseudomonas sp. FSL R10-1339 TaxID=2662196 RepID=UPI0015B4368E|nr:hypothetical protein [Pseudomonas sp. FSL R10-1339]
MFKGFDVNVGLSNYSQYVTYGRELHEKNRTLVESRLDSFKGKDGKLIATSIVAEWFPKVTADVFLSHSHRDEEEIIGLSGWLHKEFGLTSFIDSCIWGYSEKLLHMIDSEYCLSKDTGYYDYHKRNRSTSHVHMMLSTALTQTIDSCECIFFVNTPNSILPNEYIEGEKGATDSPWIYSEIAMTRLVRKRSPSEHRSIRAKVIMDSTGMEDYLEKNLGIKYDVNLNHLGNLNQTDLNNWLKTSNTKGAESLDSLYNLSMAKPIYG